MTQLSQKNTPPYAWLYDPECFDTISPSHFASNHWEKLNSVTKKETGRGLTLFIKHHDNELVLRHYLRGGMMSKLSQDHYLFTSLERTRAFSELRILAYMETLKLPAPKPAAAQVHKKGLYYQADILIHRIPDTHDLVRVLKSEQNNEFYQRLGKQIAIFHQHGIYHADLNIKNILHDKNDQFWLIDFDRARIQKPAYSWQNSNLKRLKRSFEKEVGRSQIIWNESNWKSLCEGYQSQT